MQMTLLLKNKVTMIGNTVPSTSTNVNFNQYNGILIETTGNDSTNNLPQKSNIQDIEMENEINYIVKCNNDIKSLSKETDSLGTINSSFNNQSVNNKDNLINNVTNLTKTENFLKNNDNLHCNTNKNDKLTSSINNNNFLNNCYKFNESPFEQHYDIGEQLGSGQFAMVRRVTKRATNEVFAAKFIRKRRYTTSRRGVPRLHIQREVDVLRTVGGHENVVALYDVFETTNEVILVLELVSGGELFDHVCSKEFLNEAEAAAFICQILQGIEHLHANYIVHLDLKPENIMLKKRGETLIKLVDFGLSRQIYPGIQVKDMIGTPEFVAPEIVNYEPLSSATDMWSLGIVTYILLSGGSPFLGRTREETFCNISGVKYHFSQTYFGNTSNDAKDFIARLLVKDPQRRLTAHDCLNHPWIKKYNLLNKNIESCQNLKLINLEHFQSLKIRNQWRKAIKLIQFCNQIIKKSVLIKKQGLISYMPKIYKTFDKINYNYNLPYALQNKDNILASAVFVACEEGDLNALEQLHNNYGIKLFEIENEMGETPLHISVGAGHEQIVAFLLRRGTNIYHADKCGDAPLAWAARNGHANICRMLLNGNNSNKSPVKLSNILFDVNAVNKSGETALQIATRYSQIECVLALLENGANPNIQDEHGETALHVASWHGYGLMLSILCRFNPSFDLFNKDNETALHCASTRGHIECVQSLVENGAPINAQDQSGQTALHLALKRNHVDVALFLITKGCNLDIQNEEGDTPLHIACRLGLITIVQTLCHLNAKLNIQNIQSLTPLHIAAKECHAEIVRCLCLAGCSCKIKTNDGLTAEIISFAHKNSEISSLLSKIKSDEAREQYVQQLYSLNTPLKRIKLKLFGHSNVGKSNLIYALQQTPSTSYCNGSMSIVNGVNAIKPLNSIVDAVSRRFSDNLLINSVHPTNGISQSHPAISNRSTTLNLQSSPSSSVTLSTNISSLNSKRTTDCGISGCNVSSSVASTSSTVSSTSTDSGVDSAGKQKMQKSFPINYKKPLHENYTCGIDVLNVNFPGCGEFSVWEFGGYEPYHVVYDHFVGNTDCIHIVVINAMDPTEVQYEQVLYWMNFLKGRVTPSEPIGHCGIVYRRSKVVVVGTRANLNLFPNISQSVPTNTELFTNSDAEAMMKTVKLRFETHFDIYNKIIFVDSQNVNSFEMKTLRNYLQTAKDEIVDRLQRPLVLFDVCIAFLAQLRKRYVNFPVVTWLHFTTVIRQDLNPLSTDSHCRQLVQQLQLVGEVVYLRDESLELDYVVLTPEWLGIHVIGQILSAQFLENCSPNGCYSAAIISSIFPEIVDSSDLIRILNTLQLCTLVDDPTTAAVAIDAGTFEFPAFISLKAPSVIFSTATNFVYGGMKIMPQRGMEKSLQSTFPRIQVALRNSMRDFQDPMDAELMQWRGTSKMCSGQMQAIIRLIGEAVEIQVRGPKEMASSCIYFLEDIANLVEQTAGEVAPGVCLERHFLSPKHLREHHPNPASFPPEVIMAMEQKESFTIRNTCDEEEDFVDVVCFGSTEIATTLTLGVDVSVSQLPLASRCELASLLDPPDNMGRDWSILALKLNLADQLPEVDFTGQSISRTDQLLAEWALQCPEQASIGRLCSILEELGREDARDVIYRTMPLYLFAPLEDHNLATDTTKHNVEITKMHNSD